MNARKFLSALAVVVVLTPEGFSPKNIVVPKGETVEFHSTRGRFFWPASNEHPSHGEYPAFDPKRPVKPDEFWSYRFDEIGEWKYHDHISPYFTGVVTVEESSASAIRKPHVFLSKIREFFSKMETFVAQKTALYNLNACRNTELERNDRISCWERAVVSFVRNRGLKAALAFVNQEKSQNTAFAADCHVYVHRVGEEYYWKYINEKSIEVSDNFEICDHGFFHGFMQEFTSHGQNILEAKLYCDRLIELVKDRRDADMLSLQCYHGIGHGLAYLYAPQFWGDNDEIMRRGVADCRTMFDAPRFCISGVYGGMAAMHWGLHGFTLVMDKNDPFALCKNQKKPDIVDCYDQLVPVLFGEMELDLVRAGRFIEKIKDEEMAKFLMHHLGGSPSYILVPMTDDYSSVVNSCRKFRTSLAISCLKGFSASLIRIGTLAQGVKRVAAFCESEMLAKDERASCFHSAHEQISNNYSEQDAKDFCDATDFCTTYEKE